MRQAGILAAAGLIALRDMRRRLSEDHAHARLIAETIAHHPHCSIELADVETNILFVRVRPGTAAALVAGMKEDGVLVSAIGPDSIRLVTHYDVSRADCLRAAEVLLTLLN